MGRLIWTLRDTDALSGGVNLQYCFVSLLKYGSSLSGEKLLPSHSEQFIPFIADLFSEGTDCAGNQTQNHRVVSLNENGEAKTLSGYLYLWLLRAYAIRAFSKHVYNVCWHHFLFFWKKLLVQTDSHYLSIGNFVHTLIQTDQLDILTPLQVAKVVHRTMPKSIFGFERTAKAQISLRIRAVWSGPSLSANIIIWYYRIYEWKTKARMIFCACAGWSKCTFCECSNALFALRSYVR